MQTPPRFSLVRALLFPNNDEEPLTPSQGWRVVILWAVFFTVPMVLCTLLATLYTATPLSKASILMLIVVVGGLTIFGLTARVIVETVNRSARLRQAQRNKDQ